jgi:hypothetical protein
MGQTERPEPLPKRAREERESYAQEVEGKSLICIISTMLQKQ